MVLQAGTRTSLGNLRNSRSLSLRAPQVGFSRRMVTIMAEPQRLIPATFDTARDASMPFTDNRVRRDLSASGWNPRKAEWEGAFVADSTSTLEP